MRVLMEFCGRVLSESEDVCLAWRTMGIEKELTGVSELREDVARLDELVEEIIVFSGAGKESVTGGQGEGD